jgi:broad specificity phosphatase PhoE
MAPTDINAPNPRQGSYPPKQVMRTIEIRRHGYTKKGEQRGKGSHLSAEGVALARKIGGETGPFDLVLTSPVPRALETALAMGFAVDDQPEALGDLSPAILEEIGHHERWAWEAPFVTFARFIGQGGPTTQMGERQRETWAQALQSVPTDGRVLIISHGRIIEAGLVTCIPDGDFAKWGPSFRHCEGVRLTFDDGRFQGVQLLRVLPHAV